LAIAGVLETPSSSEGFENPKQVVFFQGLLKTSGNLITTLVLPEKLQTPGKLISRG